MVPLGRRKAGSPITYRLGIDVRDHSTDWVALGQKRGVESQLASGTVDSAVALVDGELRAGSQVPAGVPVTTDFAQHLGDAKPVMVEGTPYGVESLIGHLVASVVTDARAKVGSDPGAVVFVHDDDLDNYRLGLWAEAGRLAGIPLASLTLLSRSEALAHTVAGASGVAFSTPFTYDAAVVRARPLAVTSTDAMVDGVHFRLGVTAIAADAGHRALAAALSVASGWVVS